MKKNAQPAKSNLKSKISKPQSLRVLMVEDSEDDALLIIRELKKGGYNPMYERVETAAAMKKALKEKQWDIVLCDYKLPKFNAPSAIALLKETDIDIPLIIVSGTIGEETAVECMRLGAHDYIMKANLFRLYPAINRELEEAETRSKQKQVESQREAALEALWESEEKYRNLVERASDGIGIAQDGILRYANTRLAQIGGYSVQDLIGKPFIDFFMPDEIPKVLDRYKRRMAGKKVTPIYETSLRHKNGSRIDVEVNAGVITYEGKPADLVLVRDITERKKAEEILSKSEERFRISAKSVSDCIWEWDIEKASLDWFGDIDSLLGYRRNDFPRTIDAWEKAIHPEDHDSVMSLLDKHIADHTPYNTKYRVVKKDGSIAFWVDTGAALRDENGKAYKMIGAVKDITERRQAEEELRKSEEKYRTILESIEEGYYEVDLAGNVTFVNDSTCQIYGYPWEELIGMNNRQYTSEETAKKVFAVFNEVYRTGKPGKGSDYEIIRKDGTKRHITSSVALMKDSSGKAIGFRGITQDITDRKQAEETLQDSEERFRLAFENANTGTCLVDLKGNLVRVNNKMCEIFGYAKEELERMTVNDIALPEDIDKSPEFIQKSLQGEKGSDTFEKRYFHKKGHVVTCEVASSLIRNAAGSPLYFISHIHDITERKQAEAALRESEERLKSIFRAAPTGIGMLINRVILDVNTRLCEMTGYNREELIGASARVLYPTQADFDYVGTEKYRQIAQKGTGSVETRWRKKDGTIIDVLLSSTPLDLSDLSRGVTFTALDITERKQAEEALRKSEVQYRLLADNMKDQVWLMDLNLKPTYISPSVEKSRGYTLEEIAQIPLDKHLTATSLQSAMEFFSIEMPKALADPTYYLTRLLELEFYCKDGSTLWVENTFTLIRDENGKPLSLLGVGRDITERKQAQEKLLRSEEKYRSLIENAQEGIYQSTREGRHITLNQAFAQILGYDSPKEVMATITDIAQQLYVNPEDRKKILQLVEEHGSVKGYEAEFYRKDGSRIWVSINMHAVRDEQGSLLYYQGIDQDITEKKKIDAERQENIERLRKSLGATINAMAVTVETRDPYTAGHQRRVADLARAIAVELNLKSEQIDGVRMASMIHDIGKISIPSEILTKPTQLTALEFNLIKTHPISGYNILKDIEFPWPIAQIVLEHHERIDGSGYPNGLKGEQILLESKIIAIADVVEAISSHRPYRAAHGIEVALDEVTKNKGIIYDSEIVDACLRLFREKNYKLAA